MAKKQEIDENIAEVKKAIEEGNMIIGMDKTVKELKKGKIAKVYLSSNCDEAAKAAIDEYARLTETEVIQLGFPNDEFAILCKKPFSISVVGLKKE